MSTENRSFANAAPDSFPFLAPDSFPFLAPDSFPFLHRPEPNDGISDNDGRPLKRIPNHFVKILTDMENTHTVIRVAFCLITLTLASCVTAQQDPVFMSDKDFVEHERVYSPDKSMMILNYGVDTGAFGYGGNSKAVLKLSDMSKNLRQFDLPRGLMKVEWLDTQTIAAQIDIIPSIRSGKAIEISDTEVNGIKIKVSPYDYIDADDKMRIEHRETSPDGKLELVAYRYLANLQNIKFVHISVIKKGEAIPKYGNYFIGTMTSDHIMSGTWAEGNTLLFYSNSLYRDLVQYYFVHDKPDIKFEVITDDARYASKYRWMGVK